MKGVYTRQEAVKRLGLNNIFELIRLEKKYPEAFVVVKRDPHKAVEYDKTVLDRFANWREHFKQNNDEYSRA